MACCRAGWRTRRHEQPERPRIWLGHLTPTARAAVEQCYLSEHSSREAAQHLGLTINALKTRLSRARQKLRRILSEPLRDEVAAFDLPLNDETAERWRQTRLWCHHSAKRRLLGLVQGTDRGPDFTMRCPDCWQRYGIEELHFEPHALLRAIHALRPAFKRLLQQVVPLVLGALRGPLAWPDCGTPARSRLLRGEDVAQAIPNEAHHPEFTYLTLVCPTCGPGFASPSAIVGATDPLVREFMLDRSRWTLQCNEPATFQCSARVDSRRKSSPAISEAGKPSSSP